MPSNTKTNRELFEYAIALEKASQDLYLELEKMFANNPEAARFWHQYANEEAGHAAYLESIKSSAEPNLLSETADKDMLQSVLVCLEKASPARLAGINNLDDAYILALEIENSETNAIFEFMITNFSQDELLKSKKFLRTQISTHIGRLENDFPYKGRVTRQGIKPVT